MGSIRWGGISKMKSITKIKQMVLIITIIIVVNPSELKAVDDEYVGCEGKLSDIELKRNCVSVYDLSIPKERFDKIGYDKIQRLELLLTKVVYLQTEIKRLSCYGQVTRSRSLSNDWMIVPSTVQRLEYDLGYSPAEMISMILSATIKRTSEILKLPKQQVVDEVKSSDNYIASVLYNAFMPCIDFPIHQKPPMSLENVQKRVEEWFAKNNLD
jgi:hypothetical protein